MWPTYLFHEKFTKHTHTRSQLYNIYITEKCMDLRFFSIEDFSKVKSQPNIKMHNIETRYSVNPLSYPYLVQTT